MANTTTRASSSIGLLIGRTAANFSGGLPGKIFQQFPDGRRA